MKIGNAMTHVRFPVGPTEMMNRWFAHAQTHHCAISVGNNAQAFGKVAAVIGLSCEQSATGSPLRAID